MKSAFTLLFVFLAFQSIPALASRSCSDPGGDFTCTDLVGQTYSYNDPGCSVSCGLLQDAVCSGATCNQIGQGYNGSCSCVDRSFEIAPVQEANHNDQR